VRQLEKSPNLSVNPDLDARVVFEIATEQLRIFGASGGWSKFFNDYVRDPEDR